ncbi:MAG TPA: hypothetical protein DCL21_03215 [Alphaproteobacteria bacterium]|nr:hypothetical protein [Alphaproteobacteria bacterium]
MKKLLLAIALAFSSNAFAIKYTCPVIDTWQFVKGINLNMVYENNFAGASSDYGYWDWVENKDCGSHWGFIHWLSITEYNNLLNFWRSIEPPEATSCVSVKSKQRYYQLVSLKQNNSDIKARPCKI